MTGRDTIVDTILGLFAGRVDTTHLVTNPRVAVDGDTARLTAMVEAQHLLTADHAHHALLKNLYDVDLVRDGARWVIRRHAHRERLVHRRPHRHLRRLTPRPAGPIASPEASQAVAWHLEERI